MQFSQIIAGPDDALMPPTMTPDPVVSPTPPPADSQGSALVPVAIGVGMLAVALLGGVLWNHLVYGDWKCAFRTCVVAPGWHEGDK